MVVVDVANEVVFVVEGTSCLGAYLEELKSNYILPALEVFNGGPPVQVDYGCDFSNTLYGLVTYYSVDVFPDPSSQCIEPTTSTYQFLQSLEKIQFSGGGGDGKTFLAEGLATALQLFDDLKRMRDPSISTKKHCILLCNSEPCGMPSQDSPKYHSLMAEDLISRLIQRDVNFSIISPRRMKCLYHLFDKTMTDAKLNSMKNYAVDSRHLVLLRGIQLEERPLSPGAKRDDLSQTKPGQGNVPPNQIAPGNQYRAPASQTSGAQFKNPANAMTSQANVMQGAGVRGMNPNASAKAAAKEILERALQGQVTASGSIMTSQSQDNVSHMSQPGINPGQASLATAGQGSGYQAMNNPNMVNQPRMGQQATAMRHQTLPPQGFGAMGGPQSGANLAAQMGRGSASGMQGVQGNLGGPMGPASDLMGAGASGNLLGVDINNPLNALQQQPISANQPKQVIWTGTLEWQEKSKTQTPQGPIETGNRITKKLVCHVSIQLGDPEINTMRWPKCLTMQLIPHHLLQPLQCLFKSSRTVGFTFDNQDTEGLRNLYRIMATGFAGCVHVPTQVQSDIRVLMLLYSHRKKIFMGLIPNDQQQFIAGIRTVITNQRALQQKKTGVTPGGMQQFGAGPNQPQLPGAAPQSAAQQPTMGGMPTSSTMNNPNMPTTMSQPSTMGGNTVTAASSGQMGMGPRMGPMQSAPAAAQNASQAGMSGGNISVEELERRANLEKIQNLQQNLAALRQKEMQFQQAEQQKQIHVGIGPMDGQRQQIPAQMPGQLSQQQQILQQRLQIQQQQQSLQSSNPQLKHLLQQQQLRQQMMMNQQRPRGTAPGQPMMSQQSMGAPSQAPMGAQPGMSGPGPGMGGPGQMGQPQQSQLGFMGDEFGLDMV